jgi:hypothetical protein
MTCGYPYMFIVLIGNEVVIPCILITMHDYDFIATKIIPNGDVPLPLIRDN